MGVLDDSDIEKIEQAITKKKIGKIFYNPKKARDLSIILGLIAYFAVIVAVGMGVQFFNSETHYYNMKQLASDNTDELINTANILVENSDCPTLFNAYDAIQNSDKDLTYTKNLIRNEISFRCR